MTIEFSYDKARVLQALRYHFISRPELRIMIILVNVFAFMSAALYFFGKITLLAFFVGLFLWISLMIVFWFAMPSIIYKRAATFQDHFTMNFGENNFTLGNERGSRSWPWESLTKMVETPHFFYLYFDPRSFFLVPKTGCKNPDEVASLRRLLRDKIKK